MLRTLAEVAAWLLEDPSLPLEEAGFKVNGAAALALFSGLAGGCGGKKGPGRVRGCDSPPLPLWRGRGLSPLKPVLQFTLCWEDSEGGTQ